MLFFCFLPDSRTPPFPIPAPSLPFPLPSSIPAPLSIPPPPSIPTLFPFPPPFPIPAKAGISRLLRQRRKLQYEEVQSGRCPPRPRQWEIPAFAGMGVVFFVIFLFPSLLPHFPPPSIPALFSIPAKAGISLFWCGQRPHCIIGREWKYFYLMFNARGEFPNRPRPNVV